MPLLKLRVTWNYDYSACTYGPHLFAIPLTPDPIRVQSCVWCLFWTKRNCMSLSSIFLSISSLNYREILISGLNSKWKYLLLLQRRILPIYCRDVYFIFSLIVWLKLWKNHQHWSSIWEWDPSHYRPQSTSRLRPPDFIGDPKIFFGDLRFSLKTLIFLLETPSIH